MQWTLITKLIVLARSHVVFIYLVYRNDDAIRAWRRVSAGRNLVTNLLDRVCPVMVIKHECAQGPNIIGYRLQGFPCLPERQPRSLVLSSWKEVKSQRQATCELTLQKENAKLSFLGVKSWATLDFFDKNKKVFLSWMITYFRIQLQGIKLL